MAPVVKGKIWGRKREARHGKVVPWIRPCFKRKLPFRMAEVEVWFKWDVIALEKDLVLLPNGHPPKKLLCNYGLVDAE